MWCLLRIAAIACLAQVHAQLAFRVAVVPGTVLGGQFNDGGEGTTIDHVLCNAFFGCLKLPASQ
jgi:hypothetical protein